jgi:hypothetical protein
MEILLLLCTRRYCPANIPQLDSCSNWLTPRLAAISPQPTTLLLTDLQLTTAQSQSQSQSYFMIGGLPQISSSWRQASWGSDQQFFHLNTCGNSPYVTSSLTRGWFCCLQLLLVLASAVIVGSEFRENYDHILLSQIWDSPNLECQVPVFISPSNRVAPLYRQALVSIFVASYDSQGYGGGIRPRLHMGYSAGVLII